MGVSWGMEKVMLRILLDSTKTFVVASFIVVYVDDTQWLSIHLYVVQLWKRILIFLCVQTVGMLATFDNIFSLMLKCLVEYGGLGLEELVGKLINNGCNGRSVF
jgi:hypothetical protein